jgi:YfiR/HmsC-like
VIRVTAVRRNKFVTTVAPGPGHPRSGLYPRGVSSGRRRIIKTAPVVILRTTLGLSIILFSFLVSPPSHAQMPAPLEYRTKAYFLAQFPRFIDWPETAFPSAQAPFLICILGEFSLGPSLGEFMRGTLAHGRRVEIRSVRPEQDLRSCQILFITQSKRKTYGKVLEVVQGSNVLTVGETPDFIDAGGAVSLLFEHEALHFEVNLAAANVAHLRISSGMLSLARRVLNTPESAKS